MLNTTEWRDKGYRPKTGSRPRKIEYRHSRRIGDYEVHYYAKNQVIAINKRKPLAPIPKTITTSMVLESLYVLNKNVKNLRTKDNRDRDYRLKEKVIAKLVKAGKCDKIEKHYAGPYENEVRDYRSFCRQRPDDDDYEGEEQLDPERTANVHWDHKERPYLISKIEQAYDLFHCYYFGGYSFHSPIAFRFSPKVDNSIFIDDQKVPLSDFKPISDDQFVSTRKTVRNILQARLILKTFLKQ